MARCSSPHARFTIIGRAVLLACLLAAASGGALAATPGPQKPAAPPSQVTSQAPNQAQAQAPAPAAPPCRESAAQLYQRVSPAVVAISAMSINPYDMAERMDRVSGSGFIIDANGFILTNSHVVFGRQVITVTLDEGITLPAKIVGADPVFDLAVIRIPKPRSGTLPVATLGDSDATAVGDDAFALGNPLGLDQTLTRGIVSAVNRILPGSTWSLKEPMIQTDAPINPGNSGGPLIDRCGNVIGITTANLPSAQSIGFAVPSNLAKEVVPLLVKDGRLIRPWFGVQGQMVASELKELLRMPLTDGFLVEVVEPGSPAEQVGVLGGGLDLIIGGQPVLVGGDIVTKINGLTVDTAERMAQALQTMTVGAKLRLTIIRDQKAQDIEVPITERPLMPMDMAARRAAAGMNDAPAPTSGRPYVNRRLWF